MTMPAITKMLGGIIIIIMIMGLEVCLLVLFMTEADLYGLKQP
jgi:hypothetical protein